MDDFVKTLSDLFYQMHHRGQNSTAPLCEPKLNVDLFYVYMLVPTFVILFLLAMTKSRKHRRPGCLLKCCQSLDASTGPRQRHREDSGSGSPSCLAGCQGCRRLFSKRPGLIYPMDVLTRKNRFAYAAAFGATLFLCYHIVRHEKVLFQFNGPIGLQSLVVVLSILVFATCYFPVFACLSVDTSLGSGIGTLYVWTFAVREFLDLFDCIIVEEALLIDLARRLPLLLFLLYLSLWFPMRLWKAIRSGKHVTSARDDLETVKSIQESYYGNHVCKLLARRSTKELVPPDGRKGKILTILSSICRRFIYQSNNDFQYPSRIVSMVVLGICLIYMFSIELMAQYGAVLYFSQSLTPDQDGSKLVLEIISVFCECGIVSTVLSLLIGLLNILHMMSSYRDNLLALYRGDCDNLPKVSSSSNRLHMTSFIRYTGFQVGYIAWGCLIQNTLFLILTLLLAVFFELVKYNITDWLVYLITQFWPLILIVVLMNLSHIILSKFLFLHDHGRVLAINNRRFLFIFTFYMFFYNIFRGFVSCLLRIIKAVVIGAYMLPRLDSSTLPRGFENVDAGYSAYVGFMHVECAHTHPGMVVFIQLLRLKATRRLENSDTCSTGSDCDLLTDLGISDDGADISLSRRKAIKRWQIAYTLIHNPQLRSARKGLSQTKRHENEDEQDVELIIQ